MFGTMALGIKSLYKTQPWWSISQKQDFINHWIEMQNAEKINSYSWKFSDGSVLEKRVICHETDNGLEVIDIEIVVK